MSLQSKKQSELGRVVQQKHVKTSSFRSLGQRVTDDELVTVVPPFARFKRPLDECIDMVKKLL